MSHGDVVGYEELIDGQWTRCRIEEDTANVGVFSGKATRYQFTGLLDKNGVEIYEGDILAKEEDHFWKYEVVWSEDKTRFALWCINPGRSQYIALTEEQAKRKVVIGNKPKEQ